MKYKKLIVLYARMFHPSNSGFGNAATALAECMLAIPNLELVVITTTDLPSNVKEFEGAKVYRVYRDGGFLVKFLHISLIEKILHKLGLEWFCLWVLESAQYRLGLPYLNSDSLALVWFETLIYPFIGPRVAKKLPHKTVLRMHATEDAEILAYSNEFLFKNTGIKKRVFQFCKDCKIILATNPFHLEFFQRVFLKDNTLEIWNKYQYDVVRNALDDVALQSTKDDVRERYNLNGEYCFILGRLSSWQGWAQKGFGDLLVAIALLKESNELPETFKLLIVGSGPEEKRLLRLIQNAGLQDCITHISSTSREDTLRLVENSKFVVLPSHFEGQSIFLIEALAMGKPILATYNTGASDMVDQGKNGLLVPMGDIEVLAQALVKLWSTTDLELERMGQSSRNLYEMRYTKPSATIAIQRIMNVAKWEND